MADYGDTDQEKAYNASLLVYVLLLAAPLLMVTSLVGVIIAYVYRDDAPEWLQSHFQLQVRTFWIGFLYAFISLLLFAVLIGKVLILITFIWYLVRLIKGIKTLQQRAPYPNPTGWGL